MPTDRERQKHWDRTQWEGEGQNDRPREEGKGTQVPRWHKQQWEGEGQDDIPHELEEPAPEPMGEGDHEYSGHGENPGGGERWARGYPGVEEPEDTEP